MTIEAFEHLCMLRDTLAAMGMESLLDALADGDEEAVEAVLEGMCNA